MGSLGPRRLCGNFTHQRSDMRAGFQGQGRFFTSLRTGGAGCAAKSQFRRLAPPQQRMRHGTHCPRKANFPKINHFRRKDRARERGNESRCCRKVGSGFIDPQTPRHVKVNVVLAQFQPGMRLQHGYHHGQPRRIPADDGPARRAQ